MAGELNRARRRARPPAARAGGAGTGGVGASGGGSLRPVTRTDGRQRPPHLGARDPRGARRCSRSSRSSRSGPTASS